MLSSRTTESEWYDGHVDKHSMVFNTLASCQYHIGHVYMSRYVCMHVYDVCSLISRPTLLFVIRLAFSIIHGSGGMAKKWERPGLIYHVSGHEVDVEGRG